MTLMEKLSQGLPIAIIGYVMVFVVLAILWAVIEIMRIVVTPKAAKKVEKDAESVKTEETLSDVIVEDETDESELVAVLTAAVAASLNTSTYNLKIKSFKRIDTKNNVWANASRNDAISKF